MCRKLAGEWRDTADLCDVPIHVRERFAPGSEPQGVWEFLESRDQLGRLEAVFDELGRPDLVALLVDGRVGAAEPATRPDAGPSVDMLSPVTFDLTSIKTKIDRTLNANSKGVVAFSVPYGDGVFETNICEYIALFDNGSACKYPLALTADIASPHEVIHSLVGYRDELQNTDVIFPIRAEGVDKDLIAAFLAELSAAIGPVPYRLVLFMSVSDGTGRIPKACDLHRPRVTKQDIAAWLRERGKMFDHHADTKIPGRILDRWAALIADRARSGRTLVLRTVYDELERTLTRFRNDPDEFLRFLQEGK